MGEFSTIPQRILRSVYHGPLDKVTRTGGVLVIFYCLHRAINMWNYYDPYRRRSLIETIHVTLCYIAIAIIEAARLRCYSDPKELIEREMNSSLLRRIILDCPIPLSAASVLLRRTVNLKGRNVLIDIICQILIPLALYLVMIILHYVHMGEIRDEHINKALVETEAGVLEKCKERVTEKKAVQTDKPPKSSNKIAVNTLVSNPVSSAESLRTISGCMI